MSSFFLYLDKERVKRQSANSCYYEKVPKTTLLKKRKRIYLFISVRRYVSRDNLFFTTLPYISWSNLISYILKSSTGLKK